MNLRVGLTGGIGSGKTLVTNAFARLGAGIVDTDVIARDLTGVEGKALPALVDAFGSSLIGPDGAMDRAAMRQRVFADVKQRHQLEAILHPLIRAETEAQLCRLASVDFSYVLVVIPLLIESGFYRDRVDRILVVDCPEVKQIERVMARNGLSRDEVVAILAAQVARQTRLAAADDVIQNDGTCADLEARVAALDVYYRRLSSQRT